MQQGPCTTGPSQAGMRGHRQPRPHSASTRGQTSWEELFLHPGEIHFTAHYTAQSPQIIKKYYNPRALPPVPRQHFFYGYVLVPAFTLLMQLGKQTINVKSLIWKFLLLHVQKFWIFVSNSSVGNSCLSPVTLEILKMFWWPIPHIYTEPKAPFLQQTLVNSLAISPNREHIHPLFPFLAL